MYVLGGKKKKINDQNLFCKQMLSQFYRSD